MGGIGWHGIRERVVESAFHSSNPGVFSTHHRYLLPMAPTGGFFAELGPLFSLMLIVNAHLEEYREV